MTGVTVVSWTNSIPGREQKGLEVFGKALAYFEDLAKKGRIHGHREYFSVTGKTSGFMLVEGDLEELAKIQQEPETRKLNAQAAAIVQDFRVELYAGGSDHAIQQEITTYTEGLQELGYF